MHELLHTCVHAQTVAGLARAKYSGVQRPGLLMREMQAQQVPPVFKALCQQEKGRGSAVGALHFSCHEKLRLGNCSRHTQWKQQGRLNSRRPVIFTGWSSNAVRMCSWFQLCSSCVDMRGGQAAVGAIPAQAAKRVWWEAAKHSVRAGLACQDRRGMQVQFLCE